MNSVIRDPREYKWLAKIANENRRDQRILMYLPFVAVGLVLAFAIGVPVSAIFYGGDFTQWVNLAFFGPIALSLFIGPTAAKLSKYHTKEYKLNRGTVLLLDKYFSLPRADRALFGSDYISAVKASNPEISYYSGGNGIVQESNRLHEKIAERNLVIAKMNEPEPLQLEPHIDRLKQSNADLDEQIAVYRQYA